MYSVNLLTENDYQRGKRSFFPFREGGKAPCSLDQSTETIPRLIYLLRCGVSFGDRTHTHPLPLYPPPRKRPLLLSEKLMVGMCEYE